MQLKSITAHEVFDNLEASVLFELYTQSDKHAEATGAPAVISDKLGEPFNLYGGYCFGENLDIKKDKLVIQSWRTANWPAEIDESIVILRFVQEGKDTHLYLTHADVPAFMAEDLAKGWGEWYWSKWRNYLAVSI